MDKHLRLFFIAVCFFPIYIQAQVSIDIDKTVQYQTIDGFGGFEQNTGTPDPVYIDRIINDLGVTIVRNLIPADIESVNENEDPFNTDMAQFKFTTKVTESCKGGGGPFSDRLNYMKALKAEADAKGEPLKVIMSCWSPPAWMKYTRCTSGTDAKWNRLVTSEQEALYGGTAEAVKDRKDEVAEYFYAVVKYMQQQGIEPYALSIQNELAFGEPYPACVYDPRVYPRVLSAVGKRFRDNGLKTKFFFPEDIGNLNRFAQFVRFVMNDTVAVKYADIGAVHAYATDGINAGSQDAGTWDYMYSAVNNKKKTPFWQTETSGYGTDYKAAMKLGKAMYVGLKFGKVSAWLFWGLSHNNPTEGLMASNKLPTSRYYAAKNFYRYIRPGAISVSANSSDTTVLSLAFQHDTKKTLSIVLINVDTVKSKTVNLNFPANTSSPTSFKRYLTSSSKNCSDEGTTGRSSIVLPPNSITTLVGQNSLPVITSVEEKMHQPVLSLFPNPAQDEFTVSYSDNSDNLQLQVTDISGRIIKEERYDSRKINTYDATGLPNGFYFIRLLGSRNELLATERIIISR